MDGTVKLVVVRALFAQVARHHAHPDRVVLDEGMPSAGRAWRLFVSARPDGMGGLASWPGLDNGYLGWTRREAYQCLRGLLAGLEYAALSDAIGDLDGS